MQNDSEMHMWFFLSTYFSMDFWRLLPTRGGYLELVDFFCLSTYNELEMLSNHIHIYFGLL